MPSAIAWDIDGTLLPYRAPTASHQEAVSSAERKWRDVSYVNTARPASFCRQVLHSGVDANAPFGFVSPDRFFCREVEEDVAAGKVRHLQHIQHLSGASKE